MKVDYLVHGTHLYTDKYHKLGTDSLLLAKFCQINPMERVCDLGTGCGVLLLSLYDNGLKVESVGIDIDETAIFLLNQSIQANNIVNMQGIHQDFNQYKPKQQFDTVICNPPYFSQGEKSPVKERAQARHEYTTTISQVCSTAARLLKDKGNFFICWRAERIVDLFCALRQSCLEPKEIQMVCSKKENRPYLALVKAKKYGGSGLIIHSRHIIEQV